LHRNIYRPGALTVDLGKSFKITATTQKPYPCCRFNHAPVEAALYLITTHDIKPENVVAVSITVGPGSYNNCEPFEAKRKPRNAINTQHSIPWSVASIIVHRKLGIEQNSEEAIRDSRVLDMAQKITTKLIPELKTATTAEPTIVEIKTNDGKTYTKRVDFAFGDPQNQMSFADVTDKFRYCCGFSEKKLSQKNQQAVIDMVEHLEDVPDIGQIVKLLG
jgi:2-methylcitrate dehydratase PrpD